MKKSALELVFANAKGKVFNFPGLSASGMKGGHFFELNPKQLVKLPSHAELFMLPDRLPVGLDPKTGQSVVLDKDPYSKNAEPVFAVAAFIPPGFTLTHSTAFSETGNASMLPLFAYGACCFYKGDFYVAAFRVDRAIRHDERFMSTQAVKEGIKDVSKLFPANRLVPHLANCATVNACANAKNFFLGRFEAPIPSSPACNAQCQGCISLQPEDRVPSTQKRINFVPSAQEIAELSLHHFASEKKPVVSFGQGCEGEPSLSAANISEAIRMIREKSSKGIININSNASRPELIEKLLKAGLNSIRVSLNSVREPYYSRYYQPKGYSLKNVMESIDLAKKYGAFVSLNYLSMPGFTDSRDEFEALEKFIRKHRIDMIQWRNLNYDPILYFKDLKIEIPQNEMLGMAEIISRIKKEFPKLKTGYFNPREIKR